MRIPAEIELNSVGRYQVRLRGDVRHLVRSDPGWFDGFDKLLKAAVAAMMEKGFHPGAGVGKGGKEQRTSRPAGEIERMSFSNEAVVDVICNGTG